ncbi:Phage minor structural protein GP20 [compost metagenome]
MDWLKAILKVAGLDDAKIDAIAGDAGKELPKHFVPKSQYNDVSEAKKQAEKDRDTASGQLEDLKKAAGDNEVLKKQIETLQEANNTAKTDYDAKVKDLQLSTALKLALAGDVHENALDMALGAIDKTMIELDDSGNVKGGLEDQVKSLRESKGFLFTEKQEVKPPAFKGTTPSDSKPSGGGGQQPENFGKLLADQRNAGGKDLEKARESYFN